MVQFARHALVEFAADWAVSSYHCVMCDFSSSTSEEFVHHASSHLLKKASMTVTTKASLGDGIELEHTNTYIVNEEEEDDFAMKIKLEPTEEVQSDNDESMDGMEEGLKEEEEEERGEEYKEQMTTTHHVIQPPLSPEVPTETALLCTQCRMPFDTLEELQQHIINAHSGGKKGTCNLCGKFFPKLSDLDRHVMLEHSETTAPLAQKSLALMTTRGPDTADKKSIFDNMEFISDPHASRKYRCRICKSLFKLRHHLSDHIKAIHQQLSYPCEVCKKRYKSKRALKMHLLDHQDQGVVTNVEAYHRCQICKKAFLRRHQFENHVRIRHGTMMFPCHLCDKRFTHEELLHSHMKNHKETYKFKCQICQISFVSVKDRLVHTAVHTGDIKVELADIDSARQEDGTDGATAPGVPVICSICGLTFSNDDALKVHSIKDHNDPVLFSCNSCANEFATFLDLLHHIKLQHRTFNMPQLAQPPKTSDDNLSAPGQMNADDDDYTEEGGSNGDDDADFSVESRSYFTKSNEEKPPVPEEFTNSRQRRSMRAKRFKCEDCGHCFGYQHHLTDHRNSFHKGVLYSCKTCGKQYKRRNSLKEHTCEQLVCGICKRPFQYKAHLVKHLLQMHSVDPQTMDTLEEEEEEREDNEDAGEENTIELKLVHDGGEDMGDGEDEDIKPILLPTFILDT